MRQITQCPHALHVSARSNCPQPHIKESERQWNRGESEKDQSENNTTAAVSHYSYSQTITQDPPPGTYEAEHAMFHK